MAIFPGTMGDDILASRGIAAVVADLKVWTAQRLSALPAEEGIELLKGLKARLKKEIAFEEQFSFSVSKAMEDFALAGPEDDFSPFVSTFNDLVQGYFLKRGSVLAAHALCNAYRDAVVIKALDRVEGVIEGEEMGSPPVPYCFLGSGSIGRSEQTFCGDPTYVLIHGDLSENDRYFERFVHHLIPLLEATGLFQNKGRGAVLQKMWRGSRTEWRREVVEELVRKDKGKLLELTRRADLRLIKGDTALAGEMINTVRSMLQFYRGDLRATSSGVTNAAGIKGTFSMPSPGLRDMGKGIAEMPVGLDFFSRLRVEKWGKHRGEFDLGQFALAPLINNVRLLAIKHGIHETSTIDRIKGIQEQGHLSVELTERLLTAYHHFTSFKILGQITSGCDSEKECFVDTTALDEDDRLRLKNGLEAVSGLEKIVYLSFTEEG